jgi:cyclopropane fatty-acyl-phospholipid synthase-like methyltransferase
MTIFKKGREKDPGKSVAGYYDKYTEGYLNTYGDTIQAFRPSDVGDLHRYIINSAEISDGLQILDAGCGVAGPACFFAANRNVFIEGITISAEQKRLADENVKRNNLDGRVRITLGDYHELSKYYASNAFDRVLFLESLGHAGKPEDVLAGAWEMLRPGGSVYIKDFFPFEILDKDKARRHRQVIDRINESYTYNTLNLDATVRKLRQLGFELIFIKKFEFMDDITVRAHFEEMFEIDLFGEMEEFRVAEWLELKFRKPEFPLF